MEVRMMDRTYNDSYSIRKYAKDAINASSEDGGDVDVHIKKIEDLHGDLVKRYNDLVDTLNALRVILR